MLQQQEELIEDEEEQEIKEEDARRQKREADERAKREEEATLAQSLLPESELQPEKEEANDARMTTEQVKELGEALSILSAKSSVLQERDELRALMEENTQAEEVCIHCFFHLSQRSSSTSRTPRNRLTHHSSSASGPC